MKYAGKYPLFDTAGIKTYPLSSRKSKVTVDGFMTPETALRQVCGLRTELQADLQVFARHIIECRDSGRPVILLMGAHPVKNGLAPLIIDLVNRGCITYIGINGAGAIHSFEFALIGSSSESVPQMLPDGRFGMAFETGAYLNGAINLGYRRGLGLGESLGKLFCEDEFRRAVIDEACSGLEDDSLYLKPYAGFPYADLCLFAAAYRKGVPVGVHGSIGTDIIDQHPSFSGAAKGQTSAVDFLILTEVLSRCGQGGTIMNLGSAVMGPEVVLKGVSMAANKGRPPNGIWAADFDLRPPGFHDNSENNYQYYYRDQKSIVNRIPEAFGGRGFYFEGRHQDTLVALYSELARY